MKFSALSFRGGVMGSTLSPAMPRRAKHYLSNYISSCRWLVATAFVGVLLVAEPSNARLNNQPLPTPEVSFFESGEYDPVVQTQQEGGTPAFWENNFTDEEEAKIIRDMNDANLHQKLELMAKFPEIKVEELFSSSEYGAVPVEETVYGEQEPIEQEQEFLAEYAYGPRVGQEYYLNQDFRAQETPAHDNPVQEYPAQEYPLQEYSLQEYPAQEYPAQEYPAQEYPAPEYPEQEYPAQEYPEQEYPAQEYPTQDYSTEYPVQDYLAQEYPAQAYPRFYDSPAFYPEEPDRYSREQQSLYGRMLLPSDAESSSRRLPKSTVLAELPERHNQDSTPKSANATEELSNSAGSFLNTETSLSSDKARMASDSDLNGLIQQSVSPDLIRQYSKSIREGGIEGRVVSSQTQDVKYATPAVLQEAVHRLLRKAEDAVRHFSDSSLRETFQRIMQMQEKRSESSLLSTRLNAWKAQSRWISFLAKTLEAGCPSGWRSTTDLDKVGDPQNVAVFPNCFTKYVQQLPAEQKHLMGKLVRAELQNLKAVKNVFDPEEGICSLVAGALPQLIVTSFCKDLHDVLVSTAYFIPLASKVQEAEVEEYGEAFSMMELTAASTDRLQLQAKLTILQMYRFWALSPLLEEAKHLLRVWVNDPVHKWRYTMGLYQWVTAFGLWIGEVVTSLEASGAAQ